MNVYQRELVKKYLEESQLEPQLEETKTDREALIQEGYNTAVLAQRDKIVAILTKLDDLNQSSNEL